MAHLKAAQNRAIHLQERVCRERSGVAARQLSGPFPRVFCNHIFAEISYGSGPERRPASRPGSWDLVVPRNVREK